MEAIMDQEFKKIGKRIKIIRIERGITQTNLAKALGISQTNMSNIECGRVSVTVQNLFKLHEILECTMAEFFKDIDNPTKL